MNPDERQDPTWKLLGQASQQLPTASFSQKVVRTARLEAAQEAPRSWWQRLTQSWRPWALAGGLACAMAAGFLSFTPEAGQAIARQAAPASPELVEADKFQELEELSYRSQLLASTSTELDDEDILELLVF